jgi:hypothetical protein
MVVISCSAPIVEIGRTQLRTGSPGAAGGDAAPVLGPGETQLLAQRPEERGGWISVDLPHLSIDLESGHRKASMMASWML